MNSEETTRNLEGSSDFRTKEDLKLVLREVMERVVAETIAPQFAEVKGQIANLETRFEARFIALEERMTVVESRLTAIENRLVALEAGQEELRRELKLTNSKMETLNRYILDAQGRILDVTDRMDAFERSSAA